MSIAHDFEMYYSGTYIGYVFEGVTYPFYVSSVDGSYSDSQILEEGYEDDDGDWVEEVYVDDYDPYGMAAQEALILHGHFVDDASGRRQSLSISATDPNVIFENPELGYTMIRGQWKWLAMMPQRSVKKGISGRRLGSRHFGDIEAYAVWLPSEGRVSADLLIKGDVLEYKGVTIGDIADDTISLEIEATYLKCLVENKTTMTVVIKEE